MRKVIPVRYLIVSPHHTFITVQYLSLKMKGEMTVGFISSLWEAFLKVTPWWFSHEQMLMITSLYLFFGAICTSATLNSCSFSWEIWASVLFLATHKLTVLWEDPGCPMIYRQMDCWASSAGSFTGAPFDAVNPPISAKTAGYLLSFSLHYACWCVNTSNMTHFEMSTKDVIFHMNYVWPLFAYIQWFCKELLTADNKIIIYKCKFLWHDRKTICPSFSKCLIYLKVLKQ